MLVLGLAGGEALRSTLDDEPRGSGRSSCKHGVHVRMAAVGDPLLVAGDLVSHDLAVLFDWHGDGLEGSEVASRGRLRRAIRHEQTLLGNAAQPMRPLIGRPTEHDWIASKKRCENARCETDVDARHRFADAIDVEGATAHAAKLFRDEDELNA